MNFGTLNKVAIVVLVVLFAVKDSIVGDGSGLYVFLSAVVMAAINAVADWSEGDGKSKQEPERKETVKEKEKRELMQKFGIKILYHHQEPCQHPGCLQHVSHACEYCGRIAGRGNLYVREMRYPETWSYQVIGFDAYGYIKYLKSKRKESGYVCERIGAFLNVPYTRELIEDDRPLFGEQFFLWLMDDADIPFDEFVGRGNE